MYTTYQTIDTILDVFNTYPRLTITDFADRTGGDHHEAARMARVMVINNLLSQTTATTYQLTDLGQEVIARGGWERYCLSARNSSHTGGALPLHTSWVCSLKQVKDLLLAAVSLVWVKVMMG